MAYSGWYDIKQKQAQPTKTKPSLSILYSMTDLR